MVIGIEWNGFLEKDGRYRIVIMVRDRGGELIIIGNGQR